MLLLLRFTSDAYGLTSHNPDGTFRKLVYLYVSDLAIIALEECC